MAFSDNPLEVFFDLVPTGAALYAPVYDADGELVDFRFARLNSAGQRLLGLPAQPSRTLREYYPASVPTGIFDQYRTAYRTGQPATYDVPYAGDGLDTYFRLVAQRSGDLLVVNFTDMADLPYTGAEQALRASQAREQAARAAVEAERALLQALLTQAPIIIGLYTGEDLHVVAASTRLADSVGSTVAHLVGRPLLAGVPELQGQGIDDALRQVMATHEPYIGTELPAVTRRGQELYTGYYNSVYQPLYAGDGQVIGLMSVAVEVTEQLLARQQAEQLNQELEARVQERTRQLAAAQATTERQRRQWHELFRRAPVGICIFDGPEWVYEFVNPDYQALFPGRALLGKPLVKALPEVADQPLMEILHRVYDTGEPFQAREVLVPLARTEEGPVEDIYFDLTYQARYDEAGQIDGFVTYATDVTAQVGARQERERQRQQLHRLFLEAPAAICILAGPDLVYELVNAGYQQLFPGRTLQGRPLLEALPELTGQPVWQTLRQVYQTGQPHQELGMRIPVAKQEGGPLEDFYFDYVQQPRYDAQGRVDGVVVFAFDITNQVRARQQVQDLNEKLLASNAELDESNRQLTRTNVDLDTFVYTASHDLKAPITNIESIVLALRDTLPEAVQQDEVVAHLLDLLNQTVGRFQVTIGQLTDISRLQLAHVGPAEPVGLARVVEDVRLDLFPALQAAGTHLTVEVAADLVVSFSPANLRSIVYNLLSNASKYRAPDRPAQVLVRAERTPQAVVLTVQDNGLGMNVLQQRQLFGLFQRLHTHVEGTGVGLYITKRLIENAGGTITVSSQPDAGTTFTVSFPT